MRSEAPLIVGEVGCLTSSSYWVLRDISLEAVVVTLESSFSSPGCIRFRKLSLISNSMLGNNASCTELVEFVQDTNTFLAARSFFFSLPVC